MICSICWPAMGQQAAAFATWRGRSRRISPASYKAMGQHTHRNRPTPIQKAKPEKSKSHFTPKAHETLANQRVSTKILSLRDGCVICYSQKGRFLLQLF